MSSDAGDWLYASFWVYGLVLGLVANCLAALGLVLQKYSHVRNQSYGPNSTFFLKHRWWTLGFFSFTVAQCVNLLAMAFAPQVMLSCVGACTLVFNVLFAYTILGERVLWRQFMATVGVIGGLTLVVTGTPSATGPVLDSVQAVTDLVLQARALYVLAGSLFFLVLCGLFTLFVATELFPFYWSLFAGVLSGFTMAGFKDVSLALSLGKMPWSNLRFYAVAAMSAVSAFAQLFSLNLGLKTGNAMTVVPLYFAFGMLSQVLTAGIIYEELKFQVWWYAAIFCTGGVVVLVGTVVMAQSQVELESLARGDAEASANPQEEASPKQRPTQPLLKESTSQREREAYGGVEDSGAVEPGTPHRNYTSSEAEDFPEVFDGERVYTVAMGGPLGLP
mmetsp:Transcript_219/g.486  ORF Transcript_219/g.486 Transcript_219/m.486 type:complete len:390 (+) Transcript_219:72-1241(+)